MLSINTLRHWTHSILLIARKYYSNNQLDIYYVPGTIRMTENVYLSHTAALYPSFFTAQETKAQIGKVT